MPRHLLSHLRSRRGATVVEYLVALTLVALTVMGVARLYGDTIRRKLSDGDERISEMERDGRRARRGSDQDGDKVEASTDGAGGVGGAGGGRKGRVSAASGSGVFGDGGEDGSDGASGDEDGSGVGSDARTSSFVDRRKMRNSKSVVSGASDRIRRGNEDRRYLLPGEEVEVEAGFNPLIVAIMVFGLLCLAFLIYKSNTAGSGGGGKGKGGQGAPPAGPPAA